MKKILAVCFTLLCAAVTAFANAGTYYTSIDTSKSTFVDDLHKLINPHTVISYDGYKTTIIPGYETQTASDGRTYVTCVYSGEQYFFTPPFTWDVFSREHTFCHSWMPSYPSETGPEYTDQHHLFPLDQDNANVRRSNHPLGVVVTPTYTYLDCKLGLDAAGHTVFEPRKSHKGDAARALMYMMVCYNGVNGMDWTLGHLNMVTLPSKGETTEEESLLKAWSAADPPDQWEIGRNDYIESIQHNRNPFVDHPEYVNLINFTTLTRAVPGSTDTTKTDTTGTDPGGGTPATAFTGIYEFTGGSTAVTAQPSFGTFSQMTRSSAISTASATDAFNSSSWGLSSSRDDTKYVTFTLTLSGGAKLVNLSSTLVFDSYRSGTGPDTGEVRYRYGTNTFASAGTWILPATTTKTQTMTIPAPGNTSSTVLEVRFYGWHASGSGGTMRFDNVKLTLPSNPLPVELVSFTAQRAPGGIELRWNTATEKDNYGFEIERLCRSQAAGVWKKIGFVDGHGTSNSPHSYAYTDRAAEGSFLYRLKQIDRDGTYSYTTEASAAAASVPATPSLSQNFPNPFNPSTVIDYRIVDRSHVVLAVYDVLGREVARLVDADREAGLYSVPWNAERMPAGMYIYRLTAGSASSVKKMLLQK